MRGRNKPWAASFIASHEELAFNQNESFDNKIVTLEIGIGKGDFIVQNAIDHPDDIHIGVELNTSIYAIAMKKIVNEGLSNIRLINCKALDLLEIIGENKIDRLYLNFSDPWPQNGYRKRRLVHPIHLEVFEKLIKDGGEFIFKTDNRNLFDMAVKNFSIRNYQITFVSYDYKTIPGDYVSEYEARFRALGQPIHRIAAIINKNEFKDWQDASK